MSKVGYSRRDAQPLVQARLTKTNVSLFEGLFGTSYSRDPLFSAEASLCRRETGDRGKESARVGRWEGERKEVIAPVFSLFPSSSALFLFIQMQRRQPGKALI